MKAAPGRPAPQPGGHPGGGGLPVQGCVVCAVRSLCSNVAASWGSRASRLLHGRLKTPVLRVLTEPAFEKAGFQPGR